MGNFPRDGAVEHPALGSLARQLFVAASEPTLRSPMVSTGQRSTMKSSRLVRGPEW